MANTSQPYRPMPVPLAPDDLRRYLDDELNRIAAAIDNARPETNYTILADTTLLVPLTAVPTFGRLFDDAPIDNEIDIPPTQFDDTPGVWTCVEDGIYDISCNVTATAPGAGNKQWALLLNATIAGSVREAVAGNTDNFDLSVSSSYIVPLSVGDTIFWDVGAVTDTPGGATTDVDAYAQVWRVR